MDRNHPLHNVLQEENWDSISKAPERMNTNKDDSLTPLEEGSENNKNEGIMQHNLEKLKTVIETLERTMNYKFDQQAKEMEELVGKINKLVQNNNDFESKLNRLEHLPRGPQTTLPKEEPKKEEGCKNISTMEKEIKEADVSIENIFNCSNKKFD